MSWIFWALLNPFSFSISNYIEKFLIEKKIKDLVVLTIFGGILFLFVGITIGIIIHVPLIPMKQLIVLLLSGILIDFYLIPFYKALTIDEASRITPLFQFIPVFTLILSYFSLGEQLTMQQLTGFAVILIGAFLISTEKFEKGIFTPRKSLWYMMLASLIYSLVEVLFKFAVVKQDFWVSFTYKAIGAGIGAGILLCVPHFRKNFLRQVKKSSFGIWSALIVNQSTIVFGEFAGSFAISLAPVALVTIIGGVQPVFALIEGVFLSLFFPHIIKEDISKNTLLVKMLAIGIIAGGMFLIYS